MACQYTGARARTRVGGCTYSLAERSALADGDLVTLLNTEGGGDVGGEVLVALLVTGVLGDEVEVLAADDEGTVHLGRDDGTGQDTATDRDETGEGALLVCREIVVSLVPCCRPTLPRLSHAPQYRVSPLFFFSSQCRARARTGWDRGGAFESWACAARFRFTYRCSCPQWRSWGS